MIAAHAGGAANAVGAPDASTQMDELARFDTGVVSDAMDKLGLAGVLPALVRLTTSARVVGRAVTVQLAPDDGTPATRHLGAAAIDEADDSTVIVVAGGLRTAGGWGGLLARAAKHKGVRAVVVDGVVRDIDEATDVGFPMFAAGSTPITARGRQREISTGEPVVIDDVLIRPGDIVVGDGTGVVVVPASRLPEVILAASAIGERERAMAAALDAGTRASDVLGSDYEMMLAR